MNCEWLNKLKAEAPISKLLTSVKLMRFLIWASKLLMWSRGKVLRPLLDRAPKAATTYRAFGLLATYATIEAEPAATVWPAAFSGVTALPTLAAPAGLMIDRSSASPFRLE